ncbi:hypothetical protein N7517_008783 [Penicillium concentricum]|uniref:Uncharacterized protein n=1 Tax=Penicillium concentricum TaxID=293559 RepID=A0A9W9RTD0_9EURO|nr:uncharacterized protein N7517_008783 [Penicillium concentricum]KAJ5365897.1 hypothetical protein N7517_008783 [Penicillium concentricum]
MFTQCLLVPGNEPTIQTANIPPLVNLGGIMLNPTTHAAVETQFAIECMLPLHFRMEIKAVKKIPPAYLDFTVRLREETFDHYEEALYELAHTPIPLSCISVIIFPCFTFEVTGDSKIDTMEQVYSSTSAGYIRTRGEYTRKSFDKVVRVLFSTLRHHNLSSLDRLFPRL